MSGHRSSPMSGHRSILTPSPTPTPTPSSAESEEDIRHIWVGKHTGLVAEGCMKEAASNGVREQVVVFLPLDVVANMLSRLSVRSLLRFRCVCKQWRSLISDPDFIKEQRIRALARPAIMSQKFCRQTILFYGFGDDGEIKDCSFKFKFGELPVDATMSFSNSVRGLVCGYSGSRFDGDGCHYLLNPSTREIVKLPISSQEGPEDSNVGLAFDASTGTYKVVRLFRKKDNSENCGCEILSVGTREWRYVGDTSCRLPQSQPVFVNGALHWSIYYRPHPNFYPAMHAVLAFDVKDDKFRLMPVPKDLLAAYRAHVVLFESGGHLCIGKCPMSYPPAPVHLDVSRGPTSFLIIWMLKDYTKHEWTEEHNIDMSSYLSIFFLPCIIGIRGQEILFAGHRRPEPPKIYSYDLRSGIFSELCTKASRCLDLTRESLVSPKNLTGNL